MTRQQTAYRVEVATEVAASDAAQADDQVLVAQSPSGGRRALNHLLHSQERRRLRARHERSGICLTSVLGGRGAL